VVKIIYYSKRTTATQQRGIYQQTIIRPLQFRQINIG